MADGSQPRIVFLDSDSLRADLRRPSFPHHWEEFPSTPKDQVVERLRGARIAITNKIPLRRESLEQLPELRMIAVAATGTDIVDLPFCRERGIAVANVRGYSRHTVPEHVFALILALRRALIPYQAAVQAGEWQRSNTFCHFGEPIHDLHGSTLGIVGHGTIGGAVERLGRAFGMEVLVSEHRGAERVREGRVAFDEVIERSDVLTLHAPLKPETRHMIGAAELARMRANALLINCGRGGLVDERALAEALKSGAIGGAGVDVLSTEPPPHGEDNPLLQLQLPNLVVTPHVAWASREAMQTLADQLIDNIEAWERGEPQNLV